MAQWSTQPNKVTAPPKLSVVLPVYNVSPWLKECLDSIFQQTFPAHEIVAVDDGSTDQSPKILSNYSLSHPELKVIRQENAGLSVARNSGLAQTTGTHVIFLDSDDTIEPTMFEKLFKMAVDDDLDIALCNGYFNFEGRKKNRLINENSSSSVMAGREWLRQLLHNQRIFHGVVMHLYRVDFLQSNNFCFIPGQIHEDVIWTNQVLLAAQRIRYTDKPFYNYRIRQNRSGTDKIRRSLEYSIPCSVTNTRQLIKMGNNIKNDKDLSALMRWQGVDSGFAVFHMIDKLPSKNDRLQYVNRLWNDGFFSLLWNNASLFKHKRKVARLALRRALHLV